MNRSTPIISFVIPFYNVEKYIRKCIDSIYSQNIDNDLFEVLLIDDCSVDRSRDIVLKYLSRKNLKLITHEENKYVGGGRNTGLLNATGKYIWFIDSDDFLKENVVQNLISTAEKHDLDYLNFNYCLANDQNHIQEIKSLAVETNVITGLEFVKNNQKYWAKVNTESWRKIWKRDFLIDNNLLFAEKANYQDLSHSIRASLVANRMMHINESPYCYRQNPDSVQRVEENGHRVYQRVLVSIRLKKLKKKIEDIDATYAALIQNSLTYYSSISVQKYFSLLPKEKKVFHQLSKRRDLIKLYSQLGRKNKLRLIKIYVDSIRNIFLNSFISKS